MTTREDLLSRLARARALRDAATPEPWTHNLPDNAPSPDEECTSFAVASLGGCGCCGSPWVKHGDGVLMAAAPDLVTLAEDLAAALELAEEERDRLADILTRTSEALGGSCVEHDDPETWARLPEATAELLAVPYRDLAACEAVVIGADDPAAEDGEIACLVLALREERDRLARMLACERGEPEGAINDRWKVTRDLVNGVRWIGWLNGVPRFEVARLRFEWVARDMLEWTRLGIYPSALEAIEAANAALEDRDER